MSSCDVANCPYPAEPNGIVCFEHALPTRRADLLDLMKRAFTLRGNAALDFSWHTAAHEADEQLRAAITGLFSELALARRIADIRSQQIEEWIELYKRHVVEREERP